MLPGDQRRAAKSSGARAGGARRARPRAAAAKRARPMRSTVSGNVSGRSGSRRWARCRRLAGLSGATGCRVAASVSRPAVGRVAGTSSEGSARTIRTESSAAKRAAIAGRRSPAAPEQRRQGEQQRPTQSGPPGLSTPSSAAAAIASGSTSRQPAAVANAQPGRAPRQRDQRGGGDLLDPAPERVGVEQRGLGGDKGDQRSRAACARPRQVVERQRQQRRHEAM